MPSDMPPYAPLTGPGDLTHDAAILSDMLRYGIGVGIDDLTTDGVAPGYYITPNGYTKKVTTVPSSTIHTAPQSAPLAMATGGHYEPAAPFLSPRIAPPLTPSHGGGQESDSRRRVRRGLVGQDRVCQLDTIEAHKVFSTNSPSPGYTMAFIVSSLANLDQFRGSEVDAALATWELLDNDDNDSEYNELKANMVIDTAAGDSWLFSDLTFEKFGKLGSDWTSPWGIANMDRIKSLYHKKFFFPAPPPSMRDPAHTATINYGLQPNLLQITVVQSLAKLELPGRPKRHGMPFFPIGVATASDVAMLRRVEDGILALGRGTFLKTFFPGKATWKSQPFHDFASKQRVIESPKFFISIGHPKYDKDLSLTDYIVFGYYFDPFLAKGEKQVPERDFKWVDVHIGRNLPADLEGKWILNLRTVDCLMIVDTGAAQSYFATNTYDRFNDLLTNELGAGAPGVAPDFHKDDEVKFYFEMRDGGKRAVTGQAKRFFVSPYRTDGQAKTILGTSGSIFILGLNFFRTFLVGFDESVRPPSLGFLPHTYADDLHE